MPWGKRVSDRKKKRADFRPPHPQWVALDIVKGFERSYAQAHTRGVGQ